MNKFWLILISLIISEGLLYAHRITVIDVTDKTSLSGVSVISSNGLILGFTGDNGRIDAEIPQTKLL